MKVLVEMAFDYGKTHVTGGVQEIDDVNIIRHMRRLGYGKVIEAAPATTPEPVKDIEPVKAEPKVEEPKVEKKPVAKKRTTKKKVAKK